MSLYKQFETDVSSEVNGIYLQYGNNSKDLPITFKVARAGGSNSAYHKKMEEKAKPIRRQIQNGIVSNSDIERITMEVFLETILLGWENVEDRNGNLLPFNLENAKKLFTDLPDLYRDVSEQAGQASLFRRMEKEADSKN